jgi:NADPH:quinone reductase-like Zn-dependent oxidoreductase
METGWWRMEQTAMVMMSAGADVVPQQRVVPEPGPLEALVRVRGSSLNYHDLVNLLGLIDGPWPRVPLTDGAGEVVAIGDAVTDLAVGDRVFSAFHPSWQDGRLTRTKLSVTPGDSEDGWLQQYRTFPVDSLIRVPEHLSFSEAGTLTCAGTTAWTALAGARSGDVVVTQGTGGVSLFALQLAKVRGATVILTSSSDEKLEIGRSLGADHLINYRTHPDWEHVVRDLTDGEGADLVLDLGGEQTLPRSVSATRPDGSVALIGVLSGFGTAALPVSDAMVRQIRLFGVSVGSVEAHRDLARTISAVGLKPHISHTFDWSELTEARRVQNANEHVGKIAITIP